MPLGDSVPAQRNEEEVQENESRGHNSVTAAVSNGQTTSQSKTSDISKQSPSPLHHTFLLGRARFTAQPLSALVWYGNDSGSTLHYSSIKSKAHATNNNKKFKQIKSTLTSTTYKRVKFVSLENVPVSSFWTLLL